VFNRLLRRPKTTTMSYVHGKSIIKIALAEDNLLIQDLLVPYLDAIENCKVVLQAYNGKELIEKMRQKPNTELVIMDMKMPEMDGIEAARHIKSEFPETKIIFISAFTNELACCRVISTGADGFINKSSQAAEFKKAIYGVMKNADYFYDGFSGNSIRRVIGNGRKGKIELSPEELLFLKLACTEKTYQAIAIEIKNTPRHIDYIRQGLFEKFDLNNRVELALFASNGGLMV